MGKRSLSVSKFIHASKLFFKVFCNFEICNEKHLKEAICIDLDFLVIKDTFPICLAGRIYRQWIFVIKSIRVQ